MVKMTVRSRMGHAVADKLVFCHEALHLKEKLQSASYMQKVEKWATESRTLTRTPPTTRRT